MAAARTPAAKSAPAAKPAPAPKPAPSPMSDDPIESAPHRRGPGINPMRLVGAILAAVAVVLLVLVQFVPWSGIHQGGPGSFKIDASTWEIKFSAGDESESRGWTSNDLDDSDGIGQLRTAGPFLAVGLGFAAIGAVLQFVLRKPIGPIVTLAGVAFTLVGLIVFAVGVQQFFEQDGGSDGFDMDWLASFWLAIIAVVLGTVGAALGLLPERFTPKLSSPGTGGLSY